MESFATLKTPKGFPMPAIPKRTQDRDLNKNRENDVDYCVRRIIIQKDWTTKIYDASEIDKWSKKPWSGHKEGDGVLQYALQECRWRHAQWQDCVGTPAAVCKAGVVLARDDVPHQLRSSIIHDLNTLRRNEENSMSTMALHPKYKKLLHLVHPSLYAYEKGVTHVLPDVGAKALSAPSWNMFLGVHGSANEEKPVRHDTEGQRTNHMYGNPYHRVQVEPPTAAECSKFQWLPSEFLVSSSSKTTPTCHINSYINNLHPIKYKGLYDKIGELFVETLPMMEEVLSEINDNGKVRKQKPRFESAKRWRRGWEHPHSEPVELPIPTFSSPKYTAVKKAVNLHDRPLQVIVKLISMELHPDEAGRPDFDSMTHEERYAYFHRERPDFFGGGHWHVEGTFDERIVASACCYLESENVKEEGLAFRDGSVGSGGCELGTVHTFSGRTLVWPNYLNHKTEAVQLEDETRPGHRTVCCFHLVDPTLRVRSTATVPPQQRSWMWSMAKDLALAPLPSDGLECSRIHDFMVKDGSTISYEEALERRKLLSEERSGDSRVIAENFWTPCD